MIKIIENCIPASFQDHVELIVTSPSFLWQYIEKITGDYNGSDDKISGFAYTVKNNGYGDIKYIDLLSALLYVATDKIDMNVYSIDRIRLGMFTNSPKECVHLPHVDYKEKHTAMLYYVIDSDGPTFFYDNNGKIRETVTPKKGTAVVFDGSILHSSSSPVECDRRIVVNYNFNTIDPATGSVHDFRKEINFQQQ